MSSAPHDDGPHGPLVEMMLIISRLITADGIEAGDERWWRDEVAGVPLASGVDAACLYEKPAIAFSIARAAIQRYLSSSEHQRITAKRCRLANSSK